MITVMGATGKTGKAIAEALLAERKPVRALGRDAAKLEPLAVRGAEPLTGDLADAGFLGRAFAGSDAVYVLIPPDPSSNAFRAYQDRVGEAIVSALRAAAIKNVVFLSSIGADQPSGTGPIAGLHAQEQRLRAVTGLNSLVLRPTYFFENHFTILPMIQRQGVIGGALRADLRFPQIASIDIAHAAVQALQEKHSGFEVRELLGQTDLSMNEVASILGARIGKPDLKYVQYPYDGFAAALTQAGLSPDLSRLYAEMAQAFNEGRIKSVTGRTAASTTPTTFESFADILGDAYRALGA